METVTIPKNEYQQLKQYSTAYLRIAKEITRADHAYPYDLPYIQRLTQNALRDHRAKKTIRARSVDEALRKARRR